MFKCWYSSMVSTPNEFEDFARMVGCFHGFLWNQSHQKVRVYSLLSYTLSRTLTLNLCIYRKFRIKWPWEQDRQMAIYNRSSNFIQIASQPDRIYMQAYRGFNGGWCLSHLPEAGCFISHFCANGHSKQVMKKLYHIKG